jgi:hypothetical protein
MSATFANNPKRGSEKRMTDEKSAANEHIADNKRMYIISSYQTIESLLVRLPIV